MGLSIAWAFFLGLVDIWITMVDMQGDGSGETVKNLAIWFASRSYIYSMCNCYSVYCGSISCGPNPWVNWAARYFR